MAFCGKCGEQVPDDSAFCPSCGASSQADDQPEVIPQQPEPEYQEPQQPEQSQPAYQAQVSGDADQNMGMAILAYFGPLVLIPWFAAPNSSFARFHAKEGFRLLFYAIAVAIVDSLISILRIPFIGGLITWALGLSVTILAIIGIINAVQKTEKKLPVLDKIPFEKIPGMDKLFNK